MITKQQGFTLIELMIALALGLIITAAAVAVYLANYRTLASQKSGSEMQSASLFGIQPLESRLRMANLGTEGNRINDSTPNGGIVLSEQNAPLVTDANLRTRINAAASNASTNSDQLTIQFVNLTPTPIYNCEGTEVPVGTRTIERYFMRQGNGGFALACDAGVFDATGTSLTGFGDEGVIMIAGVDQFKVRLGVQTISTSSGTGTGGTGAGSGTGATAGSARSVMTQYYAINDYLALTSSPKPSIVSIKTGVIARGTTPISISEGLDSFTLFGQTESLKRGVPRGFVRNTYETTTLLRNARAITFEPDNKGIN